MPAYRLLSPQGKYLCSLHLPGIKRAGMLSKMLEKQGRAIYTPPFWLVPERSIVPVGGGDFAQALSGVLHE